MWNAKNVFQMNQIWCKNPQMLDQEKVLKAVAVFLSFNQSLFREIQNLASLISVY